MTTNDTPRRKTTHAASGIAAKASTAGDTAAAPGSTSTSLDADTTPPDWLLGYLVRWRSARDKPVHSQMFMGVLQSSNFDRQTAWEMYGTTGEPCALDRHTRQWKEVIPLRRADLYLDSTVEKSTSVVVK